MSRMMPWGHPFYKICLMCLLFPLQRGAGLCHRRLIAAAEDVQGPGPPAAAAPPPKKLYPRRRTSAVAAGGEGELG